LISSQITGNKSIGAIKSLRKMKKVKIKTLCTTCLDPLEVEWPEQMNWAGEIVTAHEYMARALNSDFAKICCDKCLDEMPDFDFSDPNYNVEYV
jgi:hypothetical protein